MLRSLSHEEERQGVAGEVEEPLPLPGGAGLRVRGEGCCREVRREDGPNPIYVPYELGVLALHTSGGVEGGEHVRPLPCVYSTGMVAVHLYDETHKSDRIMHLVSPRRHETTVQHRP